MISVLGLLVFLVACGDSSPIEENMSETVPDFSYTTQDEETLELEDLKGNWWIADFIFTNCTDVCIPMTNNMAILQRSEEHTSELQSRGNLVCRLLLEKKK